MSRRWVSVYLVASCCLISAAAVGGRIDMTGRHIPFEVTSDNLLSGTLATQTVAPSAALTVMPQISGSHAGDVYALLVPVTGEETSVIVNGEVMFLTPEQRTNALVYRIDPRYIHEGENTIQIERGQPGPWGGTTMFSVKHGFEDVHFAQAFHESSQEEDIAVRDISTSANQDNYDVQWYDCTWAPSINRPATPPASGLTPYMNPGSEITIGIRALNSLRKVELDFDLGGYAGYNGSMTIDYVDGGAGTAALSYVNVPSYMAPRMRVDLGKNIPAGTDFVIRIGYHGAPNTYFPKKLFSRNGFYVKNSGKNILVYSESQAYGGRRWWPSKDHPSDKATTSVQRIRVPKTTGYSLQAVSNGTLINTIDRGDTTEYVWENHYPISTYLMSLAIADYAYSEATYTSRNGLKTMPVGAYIRKQDVGFEGNGHLGTLQVMNWMADTFGEYPFLDEKYVTAAWGDSFAVEHQTCTSMPAGSTSGLYNGLTRRNVHELTHQWFGNKITMDNWDHLWLNEGFATYAEALFDEHRFGYQAFRNTVRAFSLSGGPTVGPNSDDFSANVYGRGARVLDMLRFTLGDTKFFKMLKDYAANTYTTAVSQPGDAGGTINFQSVVEQSAGLPAGSLQQFFDQWLYGSANGPDYASNPTYAYSATYDIETSSVTVRIDQTQGRKKYVMAVPFRLTAANSATRDVIVPAGVTSATFSLASFRPVTYAIDPDDWILRSEGLRINSVDIPAGTVNQPYSFTLASATNVGTRSWQKLAGSPAWLNITSAGNLNGVPPAAGVYPVNLRLLNTSGHSIDASYKLVVQGTSEPGGIPDVVINEVSYETGSGIATTGEYVELYNRSNSPADISNFRLILVQASGDASSVVVVPSSTIIPAGGYYVFGNAAAINAVYPGAVNQNTGWNNSLSDGTPSGIVLTTAAGNRVDSITYRGDNSYGSGTYKSFALAEGATGRGLSWALSDPYNAAFSRLPNGKDTGSNLQDFALAPATPGKVNTSGVVLPFTDNFNSGARPEWRPAFTAPVRTAQAGASGKPPVAAPAPGGAAFLEVYDPTGGGDVTYLPGDFNKLNVEGFLWIPQDRSTNAWSTGIGLMTRAESAWFASVGFALQNAFYLEYQNGPGIGMAGGRIPNAPNQARLLAVDSSEVPGMGPNSMTVNSLGSPVTPPPSGWAPFRMVYDGPANRLYAKIAGQVIYDGPIPAGGYNTAGGIAIGFRENHSGTVSSANREGTWVDHIVVNTDTQLDAGVEDYNLY